MGHLHEKTAKNGYLHVQFSQKLLFKVKKFTKRSAWSKNFSRFAKICSPTQLFSLSLLGQNAAWTNLITVKKKNIAGQVLTYNSKNFHWLNRKTRPRMDYEWIEKTILKNQIKKIRKKKQKNQCQNAACEQKNH